MFTFFFFAHLCNFLCLPLTLYVARCGQNFFHLEECLSKFKKKMQVYISKYEALETQKRGTTMITEEVQNEVKEGMYVCMYVCMSTCLSVCVCAFASMLEPNLPNETRLPIF